MMNQTRFRIFFENTEMGRYSISNLLIGCGYECECSALPVLFSEKLYKIMGPWHCFIIDVGTKSHLAFEIGFSPEKPDK